MISPLNLALENYLQIYLRWLHTIITMVTTVYSILDGRVSELIMDTAMSDESWSKGKYRTVLCFNSKENICTHYGTPFCFELRWLHAIKILSCSVMYVL